jgi:hypothetical protein
MRASDVSCEVISGVMGRWREGDLTEDESDAYEQHLLFCPPCLDQSKKTRLALDALPRAATAVPSEDLLSRLTGIVGGRP